MSVMFDDHGNSLKTASMDQNENSASSGENGDKAGMMPTGYPLSLARDKDCLTITSMHGGRHYRRQLMDMGLRPGLQIKVMRASGRGPVLISVGETRLGIGRGMAEKIEVVPASEVGSC